MEEERETNLKVKWGYFRHNMQNIDKIYVLLNCGHILFWGYIYGQRGIFPQERALRSKKNK